MFKPLRHTCARVIALTCILACVPATGMAAETSSGGVAPDDPRYAPAERAKIVNGYAIPPRNAPRRVKRAIKAANEIVDKPYKYGGGHASVEDRGYDCSGTVSYALIGAGLLKSPMPSGGFMDWARRGKGKWITIYAQGGHMYAVIAGLRLDTGMRDPNGDRYGQAPGSGPRWNKTMRDPTGYRKRHPANF